MPSLKSLKLRVKSIRSTQKITKAMKMVAASKLKRARDKAEASSGYADKIGEMVKNLSSNIHISMANRFRLLFGNPDNKKTLVLILSSDRGLCGAFNSNVFKQARSKIKELEVSGKDISIITVGKKGHDLLKSQYSSKIIKHYEGLGKKGITYDEAKTISDDIITKFDHDEFGECVVIYSKFKSAISQIPSSLILIPLESGSDSLKSKPGYNYEPSEEEIIDKLLPRNIAVQIYRALLETSASEQGARMNAMENATKNSGDMIKKLNLICNRTRQATITKELIEIISGAEAI